MCEDAAGSPASNRSFPRWPRVRPAVTAAACLTLAAFTQGSSLAQSVGPSPELKAAAEKGDAKAQSALGDAFSSALDPVEAARWYRRAALQGEPHAQSELAQLYRTGRGQVPLDPRAAVSWYLKAARQDNASAQLALGQIFEAGEGVERDEPEALKWYTVAALQECTEALGARDRLAHKLEAVPISDEPASACLVSAGQGPAPCANLLFVVTPLPRPCPAQNPIAALRIEPAPGAEVQPASATLSQAAEFQPNPMPAAVIVRAPEEKTPANSPAPVVRVSPPAAPEPVSTASGGAQENLIIERAAACLPPVAEVPRLARAEIENVPEPRPAEMSFVSNAPKPLPAPTEKRTGKAEPASASESIESARGIKVAAVQAPSAVGPERSSSLKARRPSPGPAVQPSPMPERPTVAEYAVSSALRPKPAEVPGSALRPVVPAGAVPSPVDPQWAKKLHLKGISAFGKRRAATINGHSLFEGEETDLDVDGQTIKVRCADVRDNSALVQIQGLLGSLELRLAR
jgi:hypothetical protein